MKAFTYARVSTDEQAENGFSLRHQDDALKRYCHNNGLERIKHFEDEVSGKDLPGVHRDCLPP